MLASLVASPWLAVLVPFAMALLVGVIGSRGKRIAPWLAATGPVLLIALGAGSLSVVAGRESDAAPWTSALASFGSIEWFRIGEARLSLGWGVDSLAALMLLVVGVVALCVIVFSTGYMHDDEGYARYFALLSLFTGSMTLLVIADSFPAVFVGWELVGACSYLLIGFWYQKPSAAAAAVKAFLTTRVGDVGLLLGIAILWVATKNADYAAVMSMIGGVPTATLTAAAICIAVGAIGKSAQFPLYAWLPDAMEGPTPVSALIHAATMVAAGVYLVARVWPVFEAAPEAQLVLLAAGVISAFGASLAAVGQTDIKKVLAYSTISQLGFMFAALGAGAWVAAFFHLFTHAAFKALLFLASGSVIHGTGTQDIREMGGLRKTMPVTFAVWIAGVLALAGVFPFAGFFSKDAVLESVMALSPAIGALLFVSSALTAFYCARTTRLAFFAPPAKGLHAHESGPSMLLPLGVLAVAAVGLGFTHGAVAELLGHEAEPLVAAIWVPATVLALVGGVTGWLVAPSADADRALAARLGGVWTMSANAFGWDRLVDRVVVVPVVNACRALWAVGDRLLADGAAEQSAIGAKRLGRRLSRLHAGDAQGYAGLAVLAIALMLVVTAWLGRG